MKIIMKNVMPEAQHPAYNIPQGRTSEFKFATIWSELGFEHLTHDPTFTTGLHKPD